MARVSRMLCGSQSAEGERTSYDVRSPSSLGDTTHPRRESFTRSRPHQSPPSRPKKSRSLAALGMTTLLTLPHVVYRAHKAAEVSSHRIGTRGDSGISGGVIGAEPSGAL